MVADLFTIDENIANLGETGKPIEEIYVYVSSRLGDNRVRQILLGDYVPAEDERVIVETTISNPIVFDRKFVRR